MIAKKFKDKRFVQNILVEILGDVILVILGIIAGYYLKVFSIG